MSYRKASELKPGAVVRGVGELLRVDRIPREYGGVSYTVLRLTGDLRTITVAPGRVLRVDRVS